MQKVLVYRNRKIPSTIYDISTPELEAATFLALFNILDRNWEVYSDMPDKKHRLLYKKAKKGDAQAARELMLLRADYEYEEISISAIQTVALK